MNVSTKSHVSRCLDLLLLHGAPAGGGHHCSPVTGSGMVGYLFISSLHRHGLSYLFTGKEKYLFLKAGLREGLPDNSVHF